jgi:hypothetical protein
MTSRERKLKWIETFGRYALENAVTAILAIDGPDFLTDEQIDLITEKMVYDAREQTRRKIRNRDRLREIEDASRACEVGYQITDVLANYRKIRRDIQDRRAALSPVEESK